jgi:hypothetical protein
MFSWWQFLLLGPSLGSGADTVLSFLTLPTFAVLLISSLVFFAGLHYLLKAYLPFPSRFTADDRFSALAWAGAFAHHVPVCVLAVVTLGVAFFAPGLPPVPLWVLAWSVPFTFAYVIADTVVTCIPQLLRSPPEYEMTLHHVLGLVVTCAALLAPPELLRAWAAARAFAADATRARAPVPHPHLTRPTRAGWAPHLWVCELSNLGLGVSWWARKAGLEGGALQKGAECWFVACFVLTRIASLPVAVYGLTVTQWGAVSAVLGVWAAGACACALWLIVALQFLWLVRIARMLARAPKKPAQS